MEYKTKQKLLQKIGISATLVGAGLFGLVTGERIATEKYKNQLDDSNKRIWWEVEENRRETPGYNAEMEIREDILTNLKYLRENTAPYFESEERVDYAHKVLESLAKKIYLKNGDKIFEGDKNTHLPPSINEAKQNYLFSNSDSEEEMKKKLSNP